MVAVAVVISIWVVRVVYWSFVSLTSVSGAIVKHWIPERIINERCIVWRTPCLQVMYIMYFRSEPPREPQDHYFFCATTLKLLITSGLEVDNDNSFWALSVFLIAGYQRQDTDHWCCRGSTAPAATWRTRQTAALWADRSFNLLIKYDNKLGSM